MVTYKGKGLGFGTREIGNNVLICAGHSQHVTGNTRMIEKEGGNTLTAVPMVHAAAAWTAGL